MILTPAQARIVGSLIEKEMATPDTYPLTMNALLAACNQSSNRNPVTHLDEATVGNALENLRALSLVRIVYSRSNRADKFRHVLDEALALEPEDLALLGVLMLRGPQTASELRTRTERLRAFTDQSEVEAVLGRLAARQEPLATRLERQPGQKEHRWAHLLGGDIAEMPAAADDRPGRGEARPGSLTDRVAALEDALETLRYELDQLRSAHHDLATKLGEADDFGG